MSEYRFGVIGTQRKKLAGAISEILNTPMNYLGAPTFAYEVGNYRIDKVGTVTGEYDLNLFVGLAERGFEPEPSETFHLITPRGTLLIQERFDTAEEAEAAGYEMYFTHNEHDVYTKSNGESEHGKHFSVVGATFDVPEIRTSEKPVEQEVPDISTDSLCIEVPLDGFSPEAIENLCKMVLAKGPLIKKALDVDDLPIKVVDDKIVFDWFSTADSDSIAACTQFISQLCNTAKSKKRVTAKTPEYFENEKFAMRVWLIGLGMVGAEYKLARKILMQNLSGNGAWRYGAPEKDASVPSKVG